MFQQFFVDFWREKWSRFVETLIYLSKKTFWEKAEWCKRIQFTALRTMGKLWKFFGIKFGCTIETEFKDSGEKFWRNLSFFRIICFIYHFPTLSESFPLSSKKLCGTILKTTFRKPNKNFRGKNFFFWKMCSFVIFSDIEYILDFRRSFSTGLSKLYSECSVERYQQEDFFEQKN